MSKEEFIQECANVFESMQRNSIDLNATKGHAKITFPDGGHWYFEIKNGNHGA